MYTIYTYRSVYTTTSVNTTNRPSTDILQRWPWRPRYTEIDTAAVMLSSLVRERILSRLKVQTYRAERHYAFSPTSFYASSYNTHGTTSICNYFIRRHSCDQTAFEKNRCKKNPSRRTRLLTISTTSRI